MSETDEKKTKVFQTVVIFHKVPLDSCKAVLTILPTNFRTEGRKFCAQSPEVIKNVEKVLRKLKLLSKFSSGQEECSFDKSADFFAKSRFFGWKSENDRESLISTTHFLFRGKFLWTDKNQFRKPCCNIVAKTTKKLRPKFWKSFR